MAIKKVEVKRDLCIGAASCVVAAPSVYELDQENKAVLKQKGNVKNSGPVEIEKFEDAGVSQQMITDSAQACPTKAIYLYDENGNLIYP